MSTEDAISKAAAELEDLNTALPALVATAEAAQRALSEAETRVDEAERRGTLPPLHALRTAHEGYQRALAGLSSNHRRRAALKGRGTPAT